MLPGQRIEKLLPRGDPRRPLSFISALFSEMIFGERDEAHGVGPRSTGRGHRQRSCGLLLAGAAVAAVIGVIITAVLGLR